MYIGKAIISKKCDVMSLALDLFQCLVSFFPQNFFLIFYSVFFFFFFFSNQEKIGEIAGECWRLNNSMAGRASYVALLCESLQDLCLLALEYEEYAPKLEDEDDIVSLQASNVSGANNSVS